MNVLTRYSPVNRPGRTRFFRLLPGCLDLPVLYVPLCLLCTLPVLQLLRLGWRRLILVGGTQLHLLYCCGDSAVLKRVKGPSDLSLLRERLCFDPRGSGVLWPSAQAGLRYSMRLTRSRHPLSFQRKGGICRPSEQLTPSLLC